MPAARAPVCSIDTEGVALLEVLVRNSGHLVEKDELIKQVWPDSFVEEGNLNRNVSILRKVLGDDSSGRSYIETVPKRGYRFAAVVGEVRTNGSPVIDTEPNTAHAQAKKADVVPAAPRGVLPARGWQILAGLVVLSLAILMYVLIQSRATRVIADDNRIQVTPEERARLASAPTVNPAALDQTHRRLP